MRVLPFEALLTWILQEYEARQSIFGIHSSLFYVPKPDSIYQVEGFLGHDLATPIGPAAGPHTQLAQNIVCAWLSGGRFIELKTVQVMDELEIPRPCIDMEDEGYNVEWSQELKLDQSAQEYAKAWALIHCLRRVLGIEGQAPLGTILNMSVGYDLAGIQSRSMTRFMDRMEDASEALDEIRETLCSRFPQLATVDIPSRLVDSVTLSTMHGCPPNEIERIARYLVERRGLHTIVKLNPTLLGKDQVRRILHDMLGYVDLRIPDTMFEHDLQYARAVGLIKTLQEVAASRGLTFGVKLSNTLGMANHKGCLDGDEMYMSGRALYPVTMSLFQKLAHEFDGRLHVSYSAGADALNVATVLSAGAMPVTVATDLLKPGGYSRLLQYLDNLKAAMHERGVLSLDEFAQDNMANLDRAVEVALSHPRYKRSYHPHGLPKVQSGLALLDCIAAPCVEQCAVQQDVPGYAWWIAQGEIDRAAQAILARNPLPGVTGYVCTHLCQTRCTRNNYDEPVAIRALKRFATAHGQVKIPAPAATGHRVAIVGSGPSGLAAAFYLAVSGVQVTVFEAKDVAGGMLAVAPAFRLPPEVVREDIDRITGMGVRLELGHAITVPPEQLLAERLTAPQDGFEAVYVACGFARDAGLDIEGIHGRGVWRALDFLERARRGERPELGQHVLVIGGGNTAMDAARTARRLTGEPARVIYRRTRAEMPAEQDELEDLLAEGNIVEELVSPVKVVLEEGHVVALECVRNVLAGTDADGRRKPIPIPGSVFQIEAESIILAVGQRPDLAFLDDSGVVLRTASSPGEGAVQVDPESGSTAASCVYAGGDVARGPAIIIQACADGRRAAEAICRQLDIPFVPLPDLTPRLSEDDIVRLKRARASKTTQHRPDVLPVALRDGFDLVEQTLTSDAARDEAARCVQCAVLCDKCVEVCPNRANHVYRVSPIRIKLPVWSCRDGELVQERLAALQVSEELFEVGQTRQIVHVADLCNECGNCATFCVHQGRPYQDKPRLFLREDAYMEERGPALYLEGDTLRQRREDRESRLSIQGDELLFEDDHVRIRFSPDLQVQEATLKETFEGKLSLRTAAEMAVVLKGIRTSLPFLPGGER